MVGEGFLVWGQVFPYWRYLQDRLAGPTFPLRGSWGHRWCCSSILPCVSRLPLGRIFRHYWFLSRVWECGEGWEEPVASSGWRLEMLLNILQCTGRPHENELFHPESRAGVSDLLASLGHTGRRVVLGRTLNTQTLLKTDEQKQCFK